jgi:single-stranded-DNA-specific exonuclease
VRNVRLFGANREHASVRVTEDASGITLQAKLWRHAATLPHLADGQKIKLAFTAGINAYNGIASVELLIKDWELQ